MKSYLKKPTCGLLSLWLLILLPYTSKAIEFNIQIVDERVKNNISAFLSSKTYDCLSLKSDISRQYKDLIKTVRMAVQPFGYFNTKVVLQTSKQADCEPLQLDIELGPLTVINQAEIKVLKNPDNDFVELIAKQNIKSGQALKQNKYEQLKSQLMELASEKFYLDAEFVVQKIDVYPEKNLADITLMFDPGQRYKISEINLDVDQPFLSLQLINRMIEIKAGQYITHSQLYKVKQNLNSYGYFNQVLFEIDESKKSNGAVPIDIKLTPAAKYDYSVGLGYSTDQGAKSTFKYNNYRINDRGHQLNSQLNLSELSNEMAASYKIPSNERPASKWFNVQLAYRDEQTDNIDSQTSKIGFSETRIHKNRWQNINFIDVLHETFDTGVEEGESLLLVPGISWSLTDADQLARPSRGYKIQTEFKGASEDLLSDASFAQLTLSGKFIHTLGGPNRMLYRAQIGTTASSDFDQLPTTYRFFAGGDQSIRGFDYESISPFNSSGDLAGGKHLAVASVEFEHQFAPQWAAAVFTDFGDAFSAEFDFKYSVGAGVRWFSPIGPIRLDIGVPMDQDSNDFRIHVTIGPDL